MELQLQIFLIIGVGGFLIAALILSNSLLIHYVVKLTKKISGKNDGWVRKLFDSRLMTNKYLLSRSFPESLADPAEQANTYNNPAINLNDELNRRFTQYTPEPTMQRETQKIQSNKDSNSSQT